MTKKKKKVGKKLSATELQIYLLRYLLAHPKKHLTARQIIEQASFENNKDSVEHALRQLVLAGSAREFADERFGVALERLTTEEVEQRPAARTRALPEPSTEEATPAARRPKFERAAIHKPNGFTAEPAGSNGDEAGSEIPAPKRRTATLPAAPIENNRAGARRATRKTVEGRVDMTRSGAAYIVSELEDTDVYISPKHLNGALNGDTVRVLIFPPQPARGRRPQAARKPEGEVMEVLKRANEFFIGTLRKSRKYALFLPDNPNMPVDIYVALEDIGAARDGDKVVVRVIDWQEGKGRAPIGKVTQTLGDVGGNDFEMNKILINAGFELSHSEEAMSEAESIPDTISPQEIARRRDFRDVLTFTIDPEDAKDFDDALSIQQLENGHMEIGIHIADVTHYLKPDSPMDKEAFRRSTSVYLVDRVNPMLPEKLSNNLCSLVPYQDRLTFSAVFEFDAKDKIVKRWFGKTVIHSAHRFAYEAAQTVLDNQPDEGLEQLKIYPQLQWALRQLDRLSKKMRKEREKNGAIGFETEEVRFRLEADGTPIEAYVKERKEAHLLIEDFMLLANKEVAWYMDQKGNAQQEIPYVYRIHDLPDMEKVAEFARFASELGHPMKVDTPKQIAEAYNSLMRATREDERLKLLEPLAIRTMAKAIYSTNNIGHYGLGFTHYSHFTSPIRRYADVLAHRILDRNLGSGVARVDKSKLEEQCKHISMQEKKAADAERESIKYKQAELLRRHIGEEFEGRVSGMIERGFFVELPASQAEGMVEFRYLADAWSVEEGSLRARSRRGQVLKMGDRIRVRIAAVDLQKRQIEMEWVTAV